jgi:hypothetical protein
LLVVGLPVILAVSYGFHLLFEAPFLRHRDLRSLRTLAVLRLRLPRRTAVVPKIAPARDEA